MDDITKTTMVHNAFFEDDNADRIFYYTGKSNIKGLQAPDHVFLNEKANDYLRIMEITIPTGNQWNLIDEDIALSCFLLGDSRPKLDVILHTLEEINVHLQVTHDEIRGIISGQLEFTLSQNLLFMLLNFQTEHILAEDYYSIAEEINSIFIIRMNYASSEDFDILNNISIWIDLKKLPFGRLKSMFTYINKSLALNFMPLNGDTYYNSGYYVEYLNTKNAIVGTNITDTPPEESLVNNISITCPSLVDMIINYSIQNEMYRLAQSDEQYVVVYDPLFVPANTEQIMRWNYIKTPINHSNLVQGVVDQSGDYTNITNPLVIPTRDGLYELQLKSGLYFIQGESRVDINVYINGEIDEELSLSMYLTSNNEEDTRKAIKNTFCSPVKSLHLTANDTIVVKAICANPENVVCENETKLLIKSVGIY